MRESGNFPANNGGCKWKALLLPSSHSPRQAPVLLSPRSLHVHPLLPLLFWYFPLSGLPTLLFSVPLGKLLLPSTGTACLAQWACDWAESPWAVYVSSCECVWELMWFSRNKKKNLVYKKKNNALKRTEKGIWETEQPLENMIMGSQVQMNQGLWVHECFPI